MPQGAARGGDEPGAKGAPALAMPSPTGHSPTESQHGQQSQTEQGSINSPRHSEVMNQDQGPSREPGLE